jgi:hypothetical protein
LKLATPPEVDRDSVPPSVALVGLLANATLERKKLTSGLSFADLGSVLAGSTRPARLAR